MKLAGILVVVNLVLITNFVSLPASVIVSTLLLSCLMPARPIKNVCAAAAVVVYVRCPVTRVLLPLPTGVKPLPWQTIELTVDAN